LGFDYRKRQPCELATGFEQNGSAAASKPCALLQAGLIFCSVAIRPVTGVLPP